MSLIKKLFGNYSEKEIKRILPLQKKVLELEEEYRALSDEDLKAKTGEFKYRLENGETLDDILPDAFAAVREADERVLADPAPVVYLKILNSSSVDLSIRAWVANPNYWSVYFDMNEKMYKELPSKGIHFPFPQMDVNIKITSGPAIEKPGEMAAILNNLQEGDVLFVDEIHRLNRQVEEVLYPAMEDYSIDVVIGKDTSARSIRLDLPKFTLVGATTRVGMLTAPLRDRFGVVERMQYYEVEELKKKLIYL